MNNMVEFHKYLKFIIINSDDKQETLRIILNKLEEIALELKLDFDSALEDFDCDDLNGDCTHYNAFPCHSGAVYCTSCGKYVLSPCQTENL